MLEFLFLVLANMLESNNVAEDEIRKNEAIQKEAAITSLAAFFLVKNTDFFSDRTLKILPKKTEIFAIKYTANLKKV